MPKNYSLPFQYQGVHQCEAVVLACIDFRFWKETERFVEEKLGIKSYDFPKLPGGVKSINDDPNTGVSALCISVPCDLHHVRKVVLVNHSDCGAYGGIKKFNGDKQAQRDFHVNELKRARKIVKDSYPEKEVILVYADLIDNDQIIDFTIF